MDRKASIFLPQKKEQAWEKIENEIYYGEAPRHIQNENAEKMSLYSFKKSFFIMIFFLDREWVRERKVRTKPTKLAKTERKTRKSAEMRTYSPNAKPNYAPFLAQCGKKLFIILPKAEQRKGGRKGGENSTAITGFISLSSPSSHAAPAMPSHAAPAMQGNTPHKLSAPYSTRKCGENCMRKKWKVKVGNKCALISLYFSVAELSQKSPTNNPRTAEEDKKGKKSPTTGRRRRKRNKTTR